MPEYIDQMNRPVKIDRHPQRIVSLVPSQTELLFDLGVGTRIAGVTHFCVHPEHQVKDKQKVGGTKRIRFNKIDEISPDLIIGNKEENTKKDIEQLEKKYPVWLSDVNTLKDVDSLFSQLGNILDSSEKAHYLSKLLNKNMQQIQGLFHKPKQPTVAYLIWNKPMMVAANNTFINTMLNHIGLRNRYEDTSRYPEITLQQLDKEPLDFIFLSSEPFPFTSKHVEYFSEKFPNTKVELVDGELFSWYGTRLLQAETYFKQLAIKLN